VGDPVGFWANVLTIISMFKEPKELVRAFRGLHRRQKILVAALLIVIVGAIFLVRAGVPGAFTPVITQVMLSDDVLSMTTGDVETLTATVLYSNNAESSEVHWASSNKAIVQVNDNGQIIAVSAGSATVTAQASNRKSTMSAGCIITVTDPMNGYSISVQRTAVENYVYIYVQPKDDDVSQIIIYAKAPSGVVHTPNVGRNDLYHFYTETGTWTIYAALRSPRGTYEASKPEDFVTIEINDISPDDTDAFLAGLPVIWYG